MASKEEFFEFAPSVLSEAGDLILKYYYEDVEIHRKDDESPVTVADRRAEEFIRSQIQQKFPSHGIIGEEFENIREDAEYQWVIDPIDGTKSFISRTPLFGSLLALIKEGKPLYGALYLPVQKDILISDGKTTLFNGKEISMEKSVSLHDATILTTDYKDFSLYKPRNGFEKLMNNCRLARTWGDCYGYYLLCLGKGHIMVDPAMSVWDKMALIPIIRGAGGAISDFYGNDPADGDSIVASVFGIHEEVIRQLNDN